MKKLNFKILAFRIVNKKISLKEVEGYQIDSIAAVYRERPYWYVTEIESGTCICKGKTKQLAIEEYQKELTKNKIKYAHTTKIYKLYKAEFENLMKGQNENDNK